MLIDTHCHLNFHAFKKDLADVVRRAKEAGVEKIIIPGTDIPSSQKAVEIAQNYPDTCYAAVGIHPHHAHDSDLVINNNLKKELEKLVKQSGVVAVGEIGLDYYRYTKTKYENASITSEIKQKQKDLLTLQLELALIHNRPVILHCRQAHDDMIQTISNISRNFPAVPNYIPAQGWSASGGNPHQNSVKTLRGVWHCFGGNAKQLQDIITMGYYVGFDGNITYNEAQYSPLVSIAPLDRILLETDAPFLTPIPHRGTRNEPVFLPLVAEAVAKYHHTSPSEIARNSTTNAQNLFQIKS